MTVNQTWNPEQYLNHAGFVPVLGTPVLDMLAPQPGERILDLGCGEGSLTARIVEAGAVVLGVDSQPCLCGGSLRQGPQRAAHGRPGPDL